MLRIFNNCRSYNDPDTEYYKCANLLQKFFESKMKELGLWDRWIDGEVCYSMSIGKSAMCGIYIGSSDTPRTKLLTWSIDGKENCHFQAVTDLLIPLGLNIWGASCINFFSKNLFARCLMPGNGFFICVRCWQVVILGVKNIFVTFHL
jgi:hypothetical protein